MPLITVNYTGGGTAWVDNPNPSAGETVTLYAEPFEGATLDDIEAVDGEGYSIALYVQEEQTFEWQYDTMTITVTFSPPKIDITVIGDGAAWVSNDYPVTGDNVTLHCEPDPMKRIVSIVATDENGNIIPMRLKKEQTFIWLYQHLDIVITFGRAISHRMPIWMYPFLKEQ